MVYSLTIDRRPALHGGRAHQLEVVVSDDLSVIVGRARAIALCQRTSAGLPTKMTFAVDGMGIDDFDWTDHDLMSAFATYHNAVH